MNPVNLYFLLAFVFMVEDAFLSLALKEDYRIKSSFLLALLWPLTGVLLILAAAKATKQIERLRSVLNDFTGT